MSRRLEAGKLDLVDALAELEVQTIPVNPEELMSANTERELERARGLARA